MEIVKQETPLAQEYHNWILGIKYDLAEKFLMLGQVARDIKEQVLYKYHDCETFGEYLGAVGLDKSTVYRCIQVYEKFVEHYGLETKQLAQIGYSKLTDITPVADDDNYSEWIVKAETLSRSDLIEEIRAEKGGVKEECTEHVWVTKCKICGEMKSG